MSLGLYGGAFDPPHRGHVELARSAKHELGLDRLVVLVSADPGHKRVETPGPLRVEMAQAAFPGEEIALDVHPRTIDTLRAHPEWEGATFLVGADEFCDFLSWKEPAEILRLVSLGVATRPGFPRERLDGVLAQLDRPDRVRVFEIEPTPVASRHLRERFVEEDVPSAVAEIIRRERLYERPPGVH